MGYEVTATRKRPQSFKGLVGQEFVVVTLQNALKTGHIAKAYLFSGSRGVGKTSAARILARALNCPDTSLMGSDQSFNYVGADDISRGTALDVIEIDGASNTSVNDVRAIRDEILFPPQNNRYKIYIIDEVHMLSNSAFNALLKTIEEPPAYVVFIFATTEIHKVPATIRSRCQQFNFRLISRNDILTLLQRACSDARPAIQADDDALSWIAREAAGSMRDAYTILDQITAFSDNIITLEKIKNRLGLVGANELNTLIEHIVNGNIEVGLEYMDDLLSSGITVEKLIVDMSDYFRSLLFIQQRVQRSELLTYPREAFSKQVIQALTVNQIEKTLEMLLQVYRDIRYTLNDRLELELLISRLGKIQSYFESSEILEKIDRLRDSIKLTANAVQTEETQHNDINSSNNNDEIINQMTWKSIIENIEQKSHQTADILKNCERWKYHGDNLDIHVKSLMEIEKVRREESLILGAIKQICSISVNLILFHHEAQLPVSRVEMVKEIFQGEIIQ